MSVLVCTMYVCQIYIKKNHKNPEERKNTTNSSSTKMWVNLKIILIIIRVLITERIIIKKTKVAIRK